MDMCDTVWQWRDNEIFIPFEISLSMENKDEGNWETENESILRNDLNLVASLNWGHNMHHLQIFLALWVTVDSQMQPWSFRECVSPEYVFSTVWLYETCWSSDQWAGCAPFAQTHQMS